MNPRRRCLSAAIAAWTPLLLAAACGSDDSPSAVPLLAFSNPPSSGGATATAGTSSSAGGSSNYGDSGGSGGNNARGGAGGASGASPATGGSGGTGGRLGTAGNPLSGGSGGTKSMGGGDGGSDNGPPRRTPQCNPQTVWAVGDAVGGLSGGDRTLASVTFDEQTIAWWQADSPTTLFLSHRSQVADAFPPATSYVLPDGYGSDQLASLSHDGLRLVFARNDHLTFAQVTRSTVDQPFSSIADEAPFAQISRVAVAASWPVYGPVFSQSDLTIYYTYVPTVGASRVMRAKRQGSGWNDVTLLNDGYFDGERKGEPRHVAGVAPDETALFQRTATSGKASTVWSTLLSSKVETSVELGVRYGVQSNADCTRIYFSADTVSGREIRMATKAP